MRVKNWEKHQHFKDRCPPWIKLHRDILDQRDINVISDRSFRVLIGIWLLASEDETKQGVLPGIADIAFRLRMPEKAVTDCIHELSEFLIHDDDDVISQRYHDDDPETETETETEVDHSAAFETFWTAYPRKVAKAAARKAWGKLKPGESLQREITDGLERAIKSEQWARDGGQYIPHAATWLNGRRWEDDVGRGADVYNFALDVRGNL